MERRNNLIARVFDSRAKDWDTKKQFVTYYGAYSNIKNEVFANVKDGMNVADIGCGTGKLLSSIDKLIINSKLIGLDLSKGMIAEANKRIITDKNNISFINGDFSTYKFNDMFDMIIFSYVLHHISDPKNALIKARNLLMDDGKIVFSIPGISYLSEIFDDDVVVGRYDFKTIDEMINSSGLFPLISTRNCFKMKFANFDTFINYLKSIGTYQKVIGYSSSTWDKQFLEKIYRKYEKNKYISGEYLTYTCVDKEKMLIKK